MGESRGSWAVTGDQEEPAAGRGAERWPEGPKGGFSQLKYTTASPVLLLQPKVPRHGILCHWEGLEWTGRRKVSLDAVVTLNSQIKGGQTRWAQA